MIAATMYFEDIVLQGEYVKRAGDTEYWWYGTCLDLFLVKRVEFKWTNQQWSAICAIANGIGDPGYDFEKLYEVAEEALKGFPEDVRPIP